MPNYLQGQVKGKKIILASDFQKNHSKQTKNEVIFLRMLREKK